MKILLNLLYNCCTVGENELILRYVCSDRRAARLLHTAAYLEHFIGRYVRTGCRPAETASRSDAKLKGGPLKVVRHLLAHAAEIRVDFTRTLQGRLDMGEQIFAPDMADEIRLLKQLRGLIARTAEQERPAGFSQAVREYFERVQAGGVDCGHVPQPHDHHRRKRAEVGGRVRELLGSAEEKRPVDAQNGHIPGNLLVLQDVRAAVAGYIPPSPRVTVVVCEIR